MTNKKFGVGRSIKVETKDLIKELRILEKSSKLGEQACICGEAANRLEELLQEIEISRRLEKSENHKENDDRKQLLSKNKKKMEVKKNVLKPLQSFLKSGRKIYITGFDYDEMSYVLDIDDKYLNDFVGDYLVNSASDLVQDNYDEKKGLRLQFLSYITCRLLRTSSICLLQYF